MLKSNAEYLNTMKISGENMSVVNGDRTKSNSANINLLPFDHILGELQNNLDSALLTSYSYENIPSLGDFDIQSERAIEMARKKAGMPATSKQEKAQINIRKLAEIQEWLAHRKMFWALSKTKRRLKHSRMLDTHQAPISDETLRSDVAPFLATDVHTYIEESRRRGDKTELKLFPDVDTMAGSWVQSWTHVDDDFQGWLQTSKNYWLSIRRRKHGSLEYSIEGMLRSVFEQDRREENTGERKRRRPDRSKAPCFFQFSEDKKLDSTYANGFQHLAEVVDALHPGNCYLTMMPPNTYSIAPTFRYEDVPFPGWTREITVRMQGPRKGDCMISYAPPQGLRRVKNKHDLFHNYKGTDRTYIQGQAAKFDFRQVYCVCHVTERGGTGTFIECSFGKAGCNGWMHEECVGLGVTDPPAQPHESLVCPLCSHYLDGVGCGPGSYSSNVRLLRNITCKIAPFVATIGGLEIEECRQAHSSWGMSGTSAYCQATSEDCTPVLPIRPPAKGSVTSLSIACTAAVKELSKLKFPAWRATAESDAPHNEQQSFISAAELAAELAACEPAMPIDLPAISQEVMTLLPSSTFILSFQEEVDEESLSNVPAASATIESSSLTEHESRVFLTDAMIAAASASLDTAACNIFNGIDPWAPPRPPTPAQPTYPTSTDASVGDVKNGGLLSLSGGIEMDADQEHRPLILKISAVGPSASNAPPKIILTLKAPPPQTAPPAQAPVPSAPHPLAGILGHSLLRGLPIASSLSNDHASHHEMNRSASFIPSYSSSAVPVENYKDPDIMSVDSEDEWAAATGGKRGHGNSGYYSDDSDKPDQYSDDILPQDRVRVAKYSNGTKVHVRVDGGWMERSEGDEAEKNRKQHNKSDSSSYKNAAVSSSTDGLSGDPPVDNAATIAEQVKARAAAVDLEKYSTLSMQFKRELVESSIMRSSHVGAKNSNKKTKLKAEFEDSTLEAFAQPPMMGYLPLEDGGIKHVILSSATVPKSLHPVCDAGKLCAYCLEPLPPAKSAQKRKNLSKEAAVASMLGYSDSPVRKSFGAVSYLIHPHCLRGMNEGLSGFADVEKDAERNVELGADANEDKTSPNTAFSSHLTPGPLCEYTDPDAKDGECDLCCRAGGVLQYFTLSPACSKVSPPTEEGYLGHPPCVFWLAHSRLLEVATDTEISTVSTTEGGNDKEKQISNVKKAHAPVHDESETRFDSVLSKWRCGLCGRHNGVTTRCAAAGCAVRCHPLCVQLADPTWMLCTFECGDVDNQEDGNLQPLGMLCCTHSNSFLYN